jgi:DeoR/GlpR family transcriptional regulator of sugar metabolism
MSRRNVNNKGRKIRDRFAHLPRKAMDHPAVATLSHAQFRVLVLMAGQYNGKNNGALGLTAKQAAQQGIASERTFYRALQELEERGLIERTFPASRIPPRPTMYAITWREIDDTEYTVQQSPPKNSYRKWEASEN